MIAAMQTVILYFSSVFSMLDLTIAAATLFLTMFAVIEIGGKYPWLIYAVVSVISLIILPQKFTAVVYTLFFGWYPIAKAFFERFNPIPSYALKLLSFNVCYFIIYTVSVRILMLDETSALDGKVYFFVMFIIGNVTFIMIDVLMRLVATLYTLKLRKQLKIDKLLK